MNTGNKMRKSENAASTTVTAPLLHNRPNEILREASVLVGLLWCVALLAIVVISVLHTATMDLKVTKNFGDKIQAHYLALAGIEKARALLYQHSRNHTGIQRELYDAADQFREIQFGRGQFSIFHRGTGAEGGGIFYGVSDEGGRLNVNTARADALTNLDGLTDETAAAILAWRGETGQTNSNGANADYYASLQPPYLPRNGPFQTIRELLMVHGVTPDLLFGKDAHQNGFLPATDEETGGLDNRIIDDDGGWAAFLTVDSSVANVNAGGFDRVNVQTDDEASLTKINGITPAIAHAIVLYRAQKQFDSIANLLDVTPQPNQGAPGANANAGAPDGSGATTDNSGPQLIDENLLMQIADDITTDSAKDEPGLININTASLETLMCLPGMDRERAQAIISNTRSQGWFPNIAWLLRVPGIDRDFFKQIAPFVCTRSDTFRIVSEGKIKSTGVSKRIQAIVRVNHEEVLTVSYREDDL